MTKQLNRGIHTVVDETGCIFKLNHYIITHV